jgi:hypothetical protein
MRESLLGAFCRPPTFLRTVRPNGYGEQNAGSQRYRFRGRRVKVPPPNLLTPSWNRERMMSTLTVDRCGRVKPDR